MAASIEQCPVRWQAIHHANTAAIQTDQHTISYRELEKRIASLHAQLLNQINPAASEVPIRIACLASNGIELLLLQLVCIRAGWLFCPLNPRFTQIEIQQRLSILTTRYCWVCGESAHQHIDANTLAIDFGLFAKETLDTLVPINIQPLQPCNIIFTSGSTGFPKAVVHHYQNHVYSALGSQSLISLAVGDHNLLSLPLFHIGGYATVIRSIIAGACIHLTQFPLTLSLLQTRKITHLSLVSTQLTRLLKDPNFKALTCSIKHILLGGSAFPPSQLTALSTLNFNYHLSYGCTEMASQVATSENSERLSLLPHRELKIVEGQIYLRGKTRFMGYFQNNKVLTINEKEWVSSGDIGELSQGHLRILGRKDRQFISGGENIQPEEIERICLQHHSVKQAYLCAILDKVYGQSGVLFVEFIETEPSTFEQQCESLADFLQTQLTRFKRPIGYLNWPQNSTNNQALKIPQSTFQNILKGRGLI